MRCHPFNLEHLSLQYDFSYPVFIGGCIEDTSIVGARTTRTARMFDLDRTSRQPCLLTRKPVFHISISANGTALMQRSQRTPRRLHQALISQQLIMFAMFPHVCRFLGDSRCLRKSSYGRVRRPGQQNSACTFGDS